MSQEDTIRAVLAGLQRIAVVGASPNPARDSHRIMAYLLRQGFDVIPVNPMAETVLERACAPDLTRVEGPIDTVVCFRRSEEIPPIAQDAIAVHARALWMQLGVYHEEAAKAARQAGLLVVMNRCIMVDHRRLAAQA